ncbi:hypothetical protein PS2_036738 [Malus domestica]
MDSGLGKWADACLHCGKCGHVSQNCRLKKHTVGAAKTIEVINEALFLTVDSPLESWITTPGAAFHCSPHQGIMEKYTAGNYGKAYLANNAALDIVGRGDVRVKLPSGARWVLHNVMHVPGLKRNLISVSQLTKEGYQVAIGPEGFVVMKEPLVLSYGFEEVPDFVCFVSKEKIDPSQTKRERNLALISIAPKKDGENLDVAWGIGYLWFIDRLDLAAS